MRVVSASTGSGRPVMDVDRSGRRRGNENTTERSVSAGGASGGGRGVHDEGVGRIDAETPAETAASAARNTESYLVAGNTNGSDVL
jgi:hypothetical protein